MVKDILREIKKKWFQFVAILIITALGVGFFVGIQVTGYNMRITGDQYTKTNEIMDYLLSSSLGVDREMVDALDEALDAKVYGVINGDAFFRDSHFDGVVHAYDYHEDVGVDLTLTDGTLPKESGDVVVDRIMAERQNIQLGDYYSLYKSDVLENIEGTIVGFVDSSLYFNQDRGQSKLGTVHGFVYAQGLNTKEEVFTGVRVIAHEGVEASDLKTQIEGLQDDLMDARFHRIIDPLVQELDDAQIELDDARSKANQEFDSAWSDIKNAEFDISDAKNEIINGILEINPDTTGTNYLDYYNNSVASFEQLKTETQAQFDEAQMGIDMMPEGEEKEMASAMLQTQIEAFEASMIQVDEAHITLQNGITELETAEKDLLRAKTTFQDEKRDALKKLEDSQKDIDAGYKEIEDLDQGSFYILDRETAIVGYSAFYDDSERIESIGKVFPLVFFGVAVLVTLSTITRMVEESRIEIGIYKAMGFSSLRTTSKFTGFIFFAWLFGCILGLLLGFSFIPVLIYNAYRIMYVTPELKIGFITSYALMPVIFSFITSVGIAFTKSYKVSKETTASLLLPPSPKKGQRIFLERIGFIWKRLSFLYKVSLRNLFRNKTRFLMTLVGIGGCCGLLITGFGIQYSINSIVDKQFDEIIRYDAVVAYEKGYDLENSLVQKSDFVNVTVENVSVNNQDVSIYASDSLYDLSSMITMQGRLSYDVASLGDDAVIITEKLAIMNNIKPGDTLKFKEGEREFEVVVTEIVENYLAHHIFMSKAKFKEVMSYTKAPSMLLLQLNDLDRESFAQDVRNEDHVLSVNVLDDMKASYADMMGSFDIVIIVIVVAAFALELIVLLNLITMNMSERYKELATLKVLGFYPGELSAYVLRENIILSLLSLVVGVAFGAYLHKFVLLSAEIDMIMFNRELKTSAVIVACALTFVLSLLINLFMSRRANKVNMAEALKSQ